MRRNHRKPAPRVPVEPNVPVDPYANIDKGLSILESMTLDTRALLGRTTVRHLNGFNVIDAGVVDGYSRPMGHRTLIPSHSI